MCAPNGGNPEADRNGQQESRGWLGNDGELDLQNGGSYWVFPRPEPKGREVVGLVATNQHPAMVHHWIIDPRLNIGHQGGRGSERVGRLAHAIDVSVLPRPVGSGNE